MEKVMDRFFDLYLIQNYHYLLQFEGGHYITRNDRDKPLRLFHLQQHLEGKRTVGTFSGRYFTKFISFDVDYRDPSAAKWVTYKLADALERAGINEHAISFSGSKGYHVDVFFDKAIPVESARKFYGLIIRMAEVEVAEGGKVEYRPSEAQGVKLPLGYHQKTGSFCGFCRVSDGLRVMSPEESIAYFLAINKTDNGAILGLIADENAYDSRGASDMENAIGRHKPLVTYDQSESYTLAHAAERYSTGLTGPGQRHNSFLLLARLMNHNGVEQGDALQLITDWLTWQDRRFYESDWDTCVKDAKAVVDYVYDRNLTLTMDARDLTVTFAEVDAIIRRCPQKNQKAMMYAILVHSKRWAGDRGTFYMTYEQMAEAAGINVRTAIRQITQLEQLGVIEIIRRNQKQRGTKLKRPNVYRVTLTKGDAAGGQAFSVSDGAGLWDCLRFFYEERELRTLLPRKQYSSLIS